MYNVITLRLDVFERLWFKSRSRLKLDSFSRWISRNKAYIDYQNLFYILTSSSQLRTWNMGICFVTREFCTKKKRKKKNKKKYKNVWSIRTKNEICICLHACARVYVHLIHIILHWRNTYYITMKNLARKQEGVWWKGYKRWRDEGEFRDVAFIKR